MSIYSVHTHLHGCLNALFEESGPSSFASSRGLRERDMGSLTVLVELLLDQVDVLHQHCIKLHCLLVDDSPYNLQE